MSRVLIVPLFVLVFAIAAARVRGVSLVTMFGNVGGAGVVLAVLVVVALLVVTSRLFVRP